jgi:cytidylate kinase/predicted nucleotidyltransferase
MSHTASSVMAVSGPDNVGKSTQLRILARRIGSSATLAGSLDCYDPRWRAIKVQGTAAWWFEQATVEEVADVLTCSYLERARQAPESGLWLVDRGFPMLEASVAATVAVREGLSSEAAGDRARSILAAHDTDIRHAESAEHSVLLRHGYDLDAGIERSLAREPAVSPVYAAYERDLHVQIERLLAEGRFAAMIVTGDLSIMSMQVRLRELVQDAGTEVPLCRLPQVKVVALGGLSESGKSTAAEYLRARHGFARLKLGYLVETAAALHGIDDPYSADPVTQAELLVDGLDRYCSAHHYLDRLTIESLHRDEPVRELRKLLGDALAVVYVDTGQSLREQRGTIGAPDVRIRDAIKCERGAEAIASLADEVVGNNGSLLSLRHHLDRLVFSLTWSWRRPVVAPVETLGLPVHLESCLATLVDRVAVRPPLADLVAVTGSGARGKYQHGWSDLDVLVVAETDNLTALRGALADLRKEMGDVKLGVTLVSVGECASGLVSPRILHILAQIGTGDIGCQWRHAGLMLPVPDSRADAIESLRDGIAAAIEIRRQLLRSTADLRSLCKLTSLLAKVMLRFDGTECPSDDQALRAFAARFPGRVTDDVLCGAQSDLVKTVRLGRAVLAAWLETVPTAGRVA